MKKSKNMLVAIFAAILALCALVSCGNYYPYGYGNYCPYCGNAYSNSHDCGTASSAAPTSTPAATPTPTATPAPQVPTASDIISKLNAMRTAAGNHTLIENPGISQRAKSVLNAYIECGCADTTKFRTKRDYVIGGTFIVGDKKFARQDIVNVVYSDDFTDIFTNDYVITGSSKYVGCAAKAYEDKVYCTIIVADITPEDKTPTVANTTASTSTPVPEQTSNTAAADTSSNTSTPKPAETTTQTNATVDTAAGTDGQGDTDKSPFDNYEGNPFE